MPTLPRALGYLAAFVAGLLVSGCAEREDVMGPQDSRNSERGIATSDCGYVYSATVVPDSVQSPASGQDPEVVEFFVDLDEDGCYPGRSVEDVWVDFFPSDSGATNGTFITDSLPEGRWWYTEYGPESYVPWVLTVLSDASGEVRIPFRTNGVVGEDRITVFPYIIDGTAGPSSIKSIITTPGDFCPVDPAFLDPDVIEALRDLWSESMADASQTQRRERGAWITEEDGDYEVVPVSGQSSTSCTSTFIINPPPSTVGYVHTHPFSSGEVIEPAGCPRAAQLAPDEIRYRRGPSPADGDVLDLVNDKLGRNTPGYLLDKQNIGKYLVDDNGRLVFKEFFGLCGIIH